MSQSIFQKNYCSIFIILLTLGILAIDIWTPLGFGVWELYAVPLWLAFRMSKSPLRLIWVVAVMGSLFSVLEINISRPGGILLFAWFNRSLWAVILCAAAVVLTTARKNEAAVRESEERLRASEERYRLLTQAVPSMIYERYSDVGTFFYSDSWYEYTGLTPEQTGGDGWRSTRKISSVSGAARLPTKIRPSCTSVACVFGARMGSIDGCWFEVSRCEEKMVRS